MGLSHSSLDGRCRERLWKSGRTRPLESLRPLRIYEVAMKRVCTPRLLRRLGATWHGVEREIFLVAFSPGTVYRSPLLPKVLSHAVPSPTTLPRAATLKTFSLGVPQISQKQPSAAATDGKLIAMGVQEENQYRHENVLRLRLRQHR